MSSWISYLIARWNVLMSLAHIYYLFWLAIVNVRFNQYYQTELFDKLILYTFPYIVRCIIQIWIYLIKVSTKWFISPVGSIQLIMHIQCGLAHTEFKWISTFSWGSNNLKKSELNIMWNRYLLYIRLQPFLFMLLGWSTEWFAIFASTEQIQPSM